MISHSGIGHSDKMKINRTLIFVIFLAIAITSLSLAVDFTNKDDADEKKDELLGLEIIQGDIEIIEVTEQLDLAIEVGYKYDIIANDGKDDIIRETVINYFSFPIGNIDPESKDGEDEVMKLTLSHAEADFEDRKKSLLEEIYVKYYGMEGWIYDQDKDQWEK